MFFKRRKKGELAAQSQTELEPAESANGGPLDFELLYESYAERIYSYCLRRVGQTQEAEDLSSLVFTRAWANLDTYRGGSEAAWLFKIAHNAVANHHRARRPQISLEALVAAGGKNYLAGPDQETLERLIRLEDRAELAALVAALPAEQRELLALSVAGGLTAREIGQVLGKSEAAVWTAFHRIIRRLQANYARQAGAEKERDQ
jgi:RNA polymerase sigma-70 factor, ECF subfamily